MNEAGEKKVQNIAVQISQGCKSYGKFEVLKNLNLNVPSGAIYGLLGPSGCGKTTILRSIVGRLTLDSGEINVLGNKPGSRGHGIPGPLVGYMPQDITLYNEFNISETIEFFGMLHNMKKADVQERKEFLLEFLKLPPRDKLIKKLSGGQKRRVSMAVALLQQPRLLILDEPTVGVDPLLREKIWTHLLDISKKSGTTIMITTHYIEEARKADRVGLMRNGKLLAEESPDYLIETYKESTLEEVFLKLCIRDQDDDPTTAQPLKQVLAIKNGSSKDMENKPSSFSSRASEKLRKAFRLPKAHSFKALLYKDLILMKRTLGFLFFQLLIPFLQISLFCLCIGGEPQQLKFGIVNNESIYNSDNQIGSEIFIRELSNTTFKKIEMNWSQAYEQTMSAELWGFIDLSENFTQDTIRKFNPINPNNQNYTGSYVNVYQDSSNQQITLIVRARVIEAYQRFIKQMIELLPFQVSDTLLDTPINNVPLYGDLEPKFIDYMAPGVMLTVIFTLSIGLTALIFVIEKKEGLLERTAVANVNTMELITSHIAMNFVIMIFQTIVLIGIAVLVFGVNMKGSVFLAGALIVIQGLCGMSFGLLISSISKEESEALQVAIGVVFPALLISCIIWPVEGMPEWVQYITYFSPLTHSAEAVRSVATRGWGLSHWPIWLGFITSLAWGVFFDFVALIFFNLED